MAVYIQYDEQGNIVTNLRSFGEPPVHPRQLVFDKDENGTPIHHVHTIGKRVNLHSKKLEDIPAGDQQ